MKNQIVLLISILLVINCAYSQDKPIAYFETKSDTISQEIGKDGVYEFKINAPKQESFQNHKIQFRLIENEFGIDNSKIYLQNASSFIIDSTQINDNIDMQVNSYNLRFSIKNDFDRLIKIKLLCYDSIGNEVELDKNRATEKSVYINTIKDTTQKKIDSTYINQGHEFWLFTGTNVDLLDGAKLNELYFKGSYLLNIENSEKRTKHWIYTTFGKNRFFSDNDSLSNIRFSETNTLNSTQDSIHVITGYYNSNRQSVTDNVFFSFDYLYNISGFSSQKSMLFLSTGIYVGLRNTKITYSNSSILNSDTIAFPTDQIPPSRPLLHEFSTTDFYANLNIGLMHILSTKKVNIKTQMNAGISRQTYPKYIRTGITNNYMEFTANNRLFMYYRIDFTVVDPGISLGFETILRQNQIPVFNVSLTKVINLEKVGNLFGNISSSATK